MENGVFSIDTSPFSHSTQKRHWLFTQAELKHIREDVQRKATSVVLSVRRSAIKTIVMEPTPSTQLDAVGLMKITDQKRMSLGTDTKPPRLIDPTTPDAVSKFLSFEVSPMPESQTNHQALFSPLPRGAGLQSVLESPLRLPDFEIAEATMPPPSTVKPKKHRSADPLTFEEHATFQLYYEKALQMFATSDDLKLPATVPVWATAIVYFKRFYLMNSMMDFNPKFVMVTALNLAVKAEEQRHVTLQAIADLTGTQAAQLVQWEVPVLEGIRFHLLVFHPFRSLSGLFDALEKWRPGQMKQKKIELHEAALEVIKASYFTDLVLLFTPSQIALAALRKVAVAKKFELVTAFLKDLLAPRSPEDHRKTEQLSGILDQIDGLLEEGLRLQSMDHTEAAKVIDLKLKTCARKDKFKVKNEQKLLERKAKREHKAKLRREIHENQLAMLTANDGEHNDSPLIRSNVKKIKPSPFPLGQFS
jgi:cyclin H